MKTQLLFVSLLVVSIITGSSSTFAQRNEVTLDKFNNQFLKWFNSGRLDSISAFYLENAGMMPDNSPEIKTRASIREYYQTLYDQGFRFTQIKPTGSVKEDALMVEKGIWSAEFPNGIKMSGTYLSQWKYNNGKWLIENEMTNVDAVED